MVKKTVHYMTVEHLRSKSRSGDNDPENLRIAGMICNNRVGEITVTAKLAMKSTWYSPGHGDYATFFNRKGYYEGTTRRFRTWIDDPNQPPATEIIYTKTGIEYPLDLDEFYSPGNLNSDYEALEPSL